MLDDVMIDSAARQVVAARAALAAQSGSLGSAAPFSEPLPGYQIVKELRRGGQGVVYEALQLSTRRHVAVKVLHDAGPGPAQRRRFEREIEILSQLRHPNIVTVFDTGYAQGRHFYAMDLIAGVPLDRWTGSSPRAVLQLFVKLCEALNAAHLRGVIHRDLKPGNVLVDASGEPHVLDFGLAKFTADTAGENSAAAVTQTGQFVGTLAWASPEQTRSSPDGLDTRTDVYAIGLLLYHALTQRFPYHVDGDAAEVIDQIRRAAPQPLRGVSRARESGSSAWRIDANLETIVLTCLQKDRERRYPTAGDVGRDLARHLQGEPIAARRDSMLYVLRKHLARNRLVVSAALLVLLAVLAGLVISLNFWKTAVYERDRARDARDDAERGRREADKVVELLEDMFGSRDPNRFLGPDTTVRQMLDQHAAIAFAGLAGEPRVEARLRTALGIAYDNLGEYELAVTHLARAVELLRGLSPPPTAEISRVLNDLAMSQCALARFDEAQRALQEAHALDIAAQSPARIGHTLFNLGIVAMERGDLLAAESHYRGALAAFDGAGPQVEDDLISAERLLGGLLAELQRFAEAEPLVRDALERAERLHPPGDSRVSVCLDALGALLHQMGRSVEAVPFLRDAVENERALLGDRNPHLATNLTNLGIVLQAAGDPEGAETVLREALQLRRAMLPADHPDISQSLHALATLAERRGRLDESRALLEECIAILRANFDDQHPALQRACADLQRIQAAR